jgi:predicted nucleotidyltransferase
MSRKSISLNTARQLWAQCGGFCQNPACNRPLFRSIGDEVVSLANMAHIIGHGTAGPRSDHELAAYIDKDGINNLIMLCLDCHKAVDELERKFTVESMIAWKQAHTKKIKSLFAIPDIHDEGQLLAEVNDLLDENASIFREYGPYSDNVLKGQGGDGVPLWRKRCLDTLLPNNQRIVQLIESNKRNYSYPWDTYTQMLLYKIHSDAFQDNCLTDRKVNDYKLFPREFDYFVKTKLGINVTPPEVVEREELEFRHNQVKTYIERFLYDHTYIANLQELNRSTMLIELVNGKQLKVFVTNTYYFTDYTLDRVLEVDPAVDAIICSCPVIQYSNSAKQICIENGIGLFMLGEFMGAIRYSGEQFLNYLLRSEREDRISKLKQLVKAELPSNRIKVLAFGSFLRKKLYRDVDLLIVYEEPIDIKIVRQFDSLLADQVQKRLGDADITVTSEREFSTLKLKYNNLIQITP